MFVQLFKTFFKKSIDKFSNTVYNRFNKNEQKGDEQMQNKYSKFDRTKQKLL